VKYHAKYLVADDGPAVVASFNFTLKCFERTCDAFVLTHDAAVVSGLRQLIAADRGGRPMPAGLTPRLIVGPESSRRQITTLIGQAQSSIRVIDAKLSDPGLVALLKERRRAGLAVEVFDSKRLGALKSHGKILLIDDRIAVVGSMALASVSLDTRREVAIIVQEPAAVAEVARLFRRFELSRTQLAGLGTCRPNHMPTAARPAVARAGQEALC
jgi:phosphatidylserine/phosphatidylglycerophosphate/cardiolipin synthase-like enzyme